MENLPFPAHFFLEIHVIFKASKRFWCAKQLQSNTACNAKTESFPFRAGPENRIIPGTG
jgi:hypothetical protein